jgi:hypothetical protein
MFGRTALIQLCRCTGAVPDGGWPRGSSATPDGEVAPVWRGQQVAKRVDVCGRRYGARPRIWGPAGQAASSPPPRNHHGERVRRRSERRRAAAAGRSGPADAEARSGMSDTFASATFVRPPGWNIARRVWTGHREVRRRAAPEKSSGNHSRHRTKFGEHRPIGELNDENCGGGPPQASRDVARQPGPEETCRRRAQDREDGRRVTRSQTTAEIPRGTRGRPRLGIRDWVDVTAGGGMFRDTFCGAEGPGQRRKGQFGSPGDEIRAKIEC